MSESKIKPNFGMWLGLLGLAVVLALFWWGATYLRMKAVDDFADCRRFPGAVIQESYPARCVLSDGRSFVEPLSVKEGQ